MSSAVCPHHSAVSMLTGSWKISGGNAGSQRGDDLETATPLPLHGTGCEHGVAESCFFWGLHLFFFSEAFGREPCRAVEHPTGYPIGHPIGHSIRYPINCPTDYVTDCPIGYPTECFISRSLLSCSFCFASLGIFFATTSQGC